MCVSVFTFISYPYYKTLSATDNDLMFSKRKTNKKKRIILLFAVLWVELSTRKLSLSLCPRMPLMRCARKKRNAKALSFMILMNDEQIKNKENTLLLFYSILITLFILSVLNGLKDDCRQTSPIPAYARPHYEQVRS